MSEQTVFYVARDKQTGRYACEGHETGMGKTIESTDSLAAAKRYGGPVGIMRHMGGHYRGYEAVKVTAVYALAAESEPFPAESEVWGDDE